MDEAEARSLVVKLNQWAGYQAWSLLTDPRTGVHGIEAAGNKYWSPDELPVDAQILGGMDK